MKKIRAGSIILSFQLILTLDYSYNILNYVQFKMIEKLNLVF